MTIVERLFYRNGEDTVRARYEISHSSTSGNPRYRVFVLGDTFHATTSEGGGAFAPGPPRAVGTFNHAAGAGIDVRDGQNGWDAHEVNPVAQIFTDARSGAGFDGSIGGGPFDDAVGVQWNDFQEDGHLLGQTAVFEVLWRFSRFDALALDPASAAPTAGGTHTINVAIRGGASPVGGQTIRYTVSGANPQTGSAITDGGGAAALQLSGATAGQDVVDVFWDANGNGTQDAHEASRQATIAWQRPPLRRGETLQAAVVEGVVRFAERAPRASGGARTAQLGPFRPLTGTELLPIGTVFDTRKGTVRIRTARDRLGTRTQKGNFKGSRFQVRQSTESPLTVLRMRGGNFSRCSRDFSRGAAHTAARRIRRLRGSSRGRFRTRGRRSSATVRGTRWVTEDRCRGTLTVVRSGSVRVRDFAKRRTIVLRAGGRYLARAPRR